MFQGALDRVKDYTILAVCLIVASAAAIAVLSMLESLL
jgi:hypothetical protein